MGREVALKIVRGDREKREVRLRRMGKEARVLARLDHPHIVRPIDFGEHSDSVYFAMEYVEGRSAKTLLEEKGRVSPRDVVFLAECVASAPGRGQLSTASCTAT